MATSVLKSKTLLSAVMQVTRNICEIPNFLRVWEQCYWTEGKLKKKDNYHQHISSHATAQGYY